MMQVKTPADLEDFMNYYEFDENEKQTARSEWGQSQNQNQDRGFDPNQNQSQDRGIGKVLVGGFALKKIFGRRRHGGCYRNKSAWQPGMGSRNMPGCTGNANNACGFQQQPQQQFTDGRQPMGQQLNGQQQQYQPFRQA